MGIDFEDIKVNINNRKYQLIGKGSGRYVYDLNNGYVVKVAKNRRGLAQNDAERRIGSEDHSRIFAKIAAVSEDSHLLIMEKADRIHSIGEVWNYYHVKSNRELFRLEKFRETMNKYNLLQPDLTRRNSWGRVKGRPVIIDYGFTRDVSRFYTPFRLNLSLRRR